MKEMKSTMELVKGEINSSLFIRESLKKGLINYSALVRLLLPKIKLKNNQANSPSVLIAIQRYKDELSNQKEHNTEVKTILSGSEILMKNKVASLTIERTKQSLKVINLISSDIRWDLGEMMFIIQGHSEVTVIIDQKNIKKFDKLKSQVIEKREDLAIISLRETKPSVHYSKDVKGYIALLASTLADKNINIIDIASTYLQIFFILEEKSLTEAYNTFKELINSNK